MSFVVSSDVLMSSARIPLLSLALPFFQAINGSLYFILCETHPHSNPSVAASKQSSPRGDTSDVVFLPIVILLGDSRRLWNLAAATLIFLMKVGMTTLKSVLIGHDNCR